MQPLLFKINYDTPFTAFLYHALITATIIAAGFAINDYIDYRLKEKKIHEKIGTKIGIHFLQSFVITFTIVGVLYLFFGLGTSHFPLCSFLKHCNHSKLK